MNIENPAYFSVTEFAKKIKVHPKTIWRAIKKGRIKAFRFTDSSKGRWRIPSNELERIAFMDLQDRIDQSIEIRLNI